MKKLMVALAAVALLAGCAEKNKTLKMITEATFPPYEFLRGQEIVGIDVEICKAVAAKLGRPFSVESVNFDSVIPTVISGKADLAAAAVAALKAGRVDVVIADIDPAKNCVKGEADLALSDFITTEEYAVAIRKGQPELLKAIDETIAELKASGQLDQWIRQFTEESDKLKDK